MSVRRLVGVAVAALCLVLAVGCGAKSDDSSNTSEPSAASDGMPSSESKVAGATPSTLASQPDLAAPATGAVGTEFAPTAPDSVNASPAAIGRSVVSTAMVTVESDNVIEARQRTAAIVSSAGGAIFDEETELGETNRTTLTLKVPPDQFEAVLTQLGEVGKLTAQNISTEDVTAQVVDLDARIASAEASVIRVRGFLEKATTVSEIAQLERELAVREADLETLRGQKRTLDARVDLATIVLTVTPPVVAPAPPPPEEATSLPGFLEGLSAGWSALVSVLTVVATIGGWMLPFVPFVIALAIGFRLYRRRHPAPATEAPAA